VREGIETHLRHEPERLSRSRIKRLRKLAQPQYRLRLGEIRVFYGVREQTVEVLSIVEKSEVAAMARQARKTRGKVKQVPLAEVKDDLSRYLREAAKSEIVITRHGKPAGVLIGFESEDDWFDYRLENDPRFLQRIERARESLRAGRGTKLEDLK
jgi:prevent-host-death family protein